MSISLADGKMDFMARLTNSTEEWFDQYSGIRLESESEHGCNVSLSVPYDVARELYLKRVRVTVEVID